MEGAIPPTVKTRGSPCTFFYDGKWVPGEKIHKDKKAYNRKKMPKIEENNEE